jgi:recombination protein RecA
VVGQRVRAKVVKNKVAPPFRIAEFDMMHTNGISMEGDILDLAVDRSIVAKSGSWFKYNDTHIGQGKEKARAFLVENPEVTEELRRKVMEADGLLADSAAAVDDVAKDDESPEPAAAAKESAAKPKTKSASKKASAK